MTRIAPWRMSCAWREDANGSSSWISTSPRPSVAPPDDVVGHPALQPGHGLDDQPRRDVGVARHDVEARRRVHPGRVGGGGLVQARAAAERAAAQVLQRAARDPQQEEVEDRQEGELQPDGDRFEHGVSRSRRGDGPARSAGRRGRRGSFELERDLGGAERDAVAGGQRLARRRSGAR